MPEVYVSSIIDAPIEKVWEVLRDFNALPNWHPLVARSRIEEDRPADAIGCIRNFQLTDSGQTIQEQLLALSHFYYSHPTLFLVGRRQMPLPR